jgi:hypothetical protein
VSKQKLFFMQTLAAALLALGATGGLAPLVCAGEPIGWSDEFTAGVPGAEVPGWVSEYDNIRGVTCTSLVYSCEPSYAYISMQARDGSNGAGVLKSPLISNNVDVNNVLEMRLADLAGQTLTAWNVSLEIANDLENPVVIPLQPGTNGATGIFDYSLQNLPGVSGTVAFRIRFDTKLNLESAAQGYLLLDYLKLIPAPAYLPSAYLAQKSTKQYADFWKENFAGGAPGQNVGKWWDDHDQDVMDAEISYAPDGARIRMLPPTPKAAIERGFKVRSPGVFWNVADYPLVRVKLAGFSPGAHCSVGVIEIGRSDGADWQRLQLGEVPDTQERVFDLRNLPDWLWSQTRMLALEFYIKTDQPDQYVPNAYYDLAYVAISREVMPAALGGKVHTYATPNPFYPRRGQTTTIQLSLPDPTADFTLRICNLKGQQVRFLQHQNIWDGRDANGNLSEGGVYLYQLENNGQRSTGQITLIK